jgi:hypothetical protein
VHMRFQAAVVVLLVAILIAVVGGFRAIEQSKQDDQTSKRVAEYRFEIEKIKQNQAQFGCNSPRDRTPTEERACEHFQIQYANYEKLIALQSETTWDSVVALFR